MRDKTKRSFNGVEYGKGRLVLAVVREYAREHPDSGFVEIRAVFPDSLQQQQSPQFSSDGQCVVKKLSDVTDSRRFHMDQSDQIVCSGGTLVVSREWNIVNIEHFLAKARGLGFHIKKLTNQY